jgi:hypothetical protein
LENGSDITIGRPLIGAINLKEPSIRYRFVELLVDRGLDVNKLYDLYGNPNELFTALDWTSDERVANSLRKRGAKQAFELIPERKCVFKPNRTGKLHSKESPRGRGK